MRFKKGEMVTENAIGLILAAAATFVLIFLMISLFTPTFNKGEEGAESYLKSLGAAIDEADVERASTFFMLDMEDEELEFYLVYFGEAFIFIEDEGEFVRSPRDGPLCICYLQNEKLSCDDCMDLKGSVSYADEAPWVIREGDYVNINKVGVGYGLTLA